MRKKYIQKQVTDVVWISDDGKEHSSRYSAVQQDAAIIYNKGKRDIPSTGISLPDDEYYMDLYFIKNEEDWKYLNYTEWEQNSTGDKFSGTGWYGVICHDGGDYTDSYEIIKIGPYIKKQEIYLQELKHLTSFENMV